MPIAFGNVLNTDYTNDETGGTFAATPAEPSANVDGVLQIYVQAINDQTAGNFTSSAGALTIVVGPTNAPTLFQSGIQRRAGLTADPNPIDCNNTNGASAQKSALILIITGHDVGSPIRAVGTTATGTSTAPQCPNTAAATAGDLVLRIASWHDDGDGAAVTRTGGGYTAGPLFQPAASNGKAFVVDFLISAGGAPGTGTFGIAASRPWTADTIVIAAAAAGGSGGVLVQGVLVNGLLLGSLA